MFSVLFSFILLFSSNNFSSTHSIDTENRMNNNQRITINFSVDSNTPDTFMLTNLSYALTNCYENCLEYASFSANSEEHFLGKISFYINKDPVLWKQATYIMGNGSLLAIKEINRLKNDPSPQSHDIDYSDDFWIGTTKTFSGVTLTEEKRKQIFENNPEEREKLIGGSHITITQPTDKSAIKEIYWDIENLGVFLSNKSQPTEIELKTQKPIRSLTIKYIPKSQSFEGKKETIACTEENQDICSFKAPVDILKKSKAILVTIHED